MANFHDNTDIVQRIVEFSGQTHGNQAVIITPTYPDLTVGGART